MSPRNQKLVKYGVCTSGACGHCGTIKIHNSHPPPKLALAQTVDAVKHQPVPGPTVPAGQIKSSTVLQCAEGKENIPIYCHLVLQDRSAPRLLRRIAPQKHQPTNRIRRHNTMNSFLAPKEINWSIESGLCQHSIRASLTIFGFLCAVRVKMLMYCLLSLGSNGRWR